MKRLRFHELMLLSEKERTGRSVPFKSLVTVIKGRNDYGKSCLLKSLYTALGATPRNIHPDWIKLEVNLLLHFSIEDHEYKILKMGKQFGLFGNDDSLIGVYSSITNELGPKFAELFDFRLELINATSRKPEQATPACLFLPFYVDQDRGWIETWESFENLSQFKGHRQATSHFHTGLKPNAYYEAKSKKINALDRRERLRSDRAVIDRVMDKIDALLRTTQFDLDVENFQREIERLLVICNQLKDDENRIREEMIEIENNRISLQRQIQILEHATMELNEDFAHASKNLPDEVECPTCGAEYKNTFAERFAIAADEDQLRALLTETKSERDSLLAKAKQKQKLSGDVASRIESITSLLETKQGEVKLQDLFLSQGKKEVRKVLGDELDELNRLIGSVDSEIVNAETAMKQLTSKSRTMEIKSYYSMTMTRYLADLRVPGLSKENYKEVDCIIRESGSDLPRALLAFYFSIFRTIEKYSTTTRCPIVLDSPKQQDQDDDNWRQILTFLRDNRPEKSQLIIGLVNDLEIDLGGDVIELHNERQLLQKSQYETVAALVRPFQDAVLNF